MLLSSLSIVKTVINFLVAKIVYVVKKKIKFLLLNWKNYVMKGAKKQVGIPNAVNALLIRNQMEILIHKLS